MTTDNILNEENNEKENSQVEENSPEEEIPASQESQGETSNSEETAEQASSDSSFNEGDKVTGTVLKVEEKFVRAHIDGTDFEGIIPILSLIHI